MPTVYGTLLNYCGALAALGKAVHEPPYHALPRAPVLYVKPRNTLAASGDAVLVPPGIDALQVGAALGLVIGRTACRIPEARALDFLAGYVIANDVCVPHDSFFRPAVRHQARDGFCPIGPMKRREAIADPDALVLRVFVDGRLVQRNTTANLIRPVRRLLADVTAFMTLSPGDILLVGVPEDAPTVRPWQRAAIEIDGLCRLENPFVTEAST